MARKLIVPTNILNLQAYRVISLAENAHDYHVEAETTTQPTHCIHCKSDNMVGFGRRVQMIKDLAMHGKRVGIYVNTRRFKCRACSKTFYEPLPEIDEKRMMTARLAEWIGKQSVKRTFTSIAEEIGITEGTVRSVFHDHVNSNQKKQSPSNRGGDGQCR